MISSEGLGWINDLKRNNYKKLYTVLSCLGDLPFVRVVCLLVSCVLLLVLSCLLCDCCCLTVCILVFFVCVVILCVFVVLCGHCIFYFRCPTAGWKSVFGRSYDRPPRHRFLLVSLCLKANAEMVPKTKSCHFMLLM